VKFCKEGALGPLSAVLFLCSEARASPFLLPMTFRFINCSNNQRIDVQAADHDQALRAAATIAGHFFLTFIKAF
jgi:hypothetical protein